MVQVIFFDVLQFFLVVHIHDPSPLISSILLFTIIACVPLFHPPSISIMSLFLAVAVQSHFFFQLFSRKCNLYHTTVITLMTVSNICRRNGQKIISAWIEIQLAHIICTFAFIYGMYDRTSKVYLSRHLVFEEFDDELVSLSIGLSSRTTRELQ